MFTELFLIEDIRVERTCEEKDRHEQKTSRATMCEGTAESDRRGFRAQFRERRSLGRPGVRGWCEKTSAAIVQARTKRTRWQRREE